MIKKETISQPELFFEQLVDPQNPKKDIAMQGLYKILGIKAEGPILSWLPISAMMMDGSGLEATPSREIPVIMKRINLLSNQYPWLLKSFAKLSTEASLTAKDFKYWARDHVFDDFPGLFGISHYEAVDLRSSVMIDFEPNSEKAQQIADYAGLILDL